ncbi:nucleolar protein 12 isoform X1 [Trichosurus vulpecula]|uniref:nucleolar protein 12 isoform X1 n=1 Tax=Trichosurus vulpecula TaxID=9337 RepID=UPI00186B3CEA|nr:nucleolar protein 12 isoform X1 [Trichosurus vulpecula]
MARKKKNKKDRDGSQGRLVLTFDEEKRRDYLTGFHKRKVERRKVALEEIRKKLKEEQRKLRDERHKEYLKMLKDREAALEEADELDQLVTSKTQCVQYDHPNHTVTVTTISDLDLSGARRLGLPPPGGEGDPEAEGAEAFADGPITALPKKSRSPFLSQRISSLTASLHARSQKRAKKKRPRPHRSLESKKPPSATRTSKTHRRRMTGRAGNRRDGSPG